MGFSTLTNNSDAVKLIFDHYRNAGIAAVVLGASGYMFQMAARGSMPVFTYGASASLALIGLFLFVLNERHGKGRLEAAKLPPWLELSIIAVHSFSVVMLVSVLLMRSPV